jgi:hypothetical protein
MPYSLSQYQYGIPASFTFQKHPEPHRQLTREQDLDYRMQRAFRSTPEETLASYLERLAYRVRYYRFYLYAPLYLAMAVFLGGIRNYRHAWVPLTLVLFALGVNFFPIFNFHYIAAASCLFILMSVDGLRRLGRMRMGSAAARALIYLCIAQFVFAYGLHLFERQDFAAAMRPYDVWDSINHQNPEQRIQINRQIAGTPGKLLIFVRYWPQHIFQNEWVYNEADIDGARVVWARDLGEDEDAKLRQYYPGRVALLLEPDARPPRLTAYRPEPPKPSAPRQRPEKNKKDVPKMPLEPVV